jgi:hypothetical protein
LVEVEVVDLLQIPVDPVVKAAWEHLLLFLDQASLQPLTAEAVLVEGLEIFK